MWLCLLPGRRFLFGRFVRGQNGRHRENACDAGCRLFRLFSDRFHFFGHRRVDFQRKLDVAVFYDQSGRDTGVNDVMVAVRQLHRFEGGYNFGFGNLRHP